VPLFHKCPTCPNDRTTWIDRAQAKCASCRGVVFVKPQVSRVVSIRNSPETDELFCLGCDKIPIGKLISGLCKECRTKEQIKQKYTESLLDDIVLTDDPVDDIEFLSD
jgi:hypothetical protein